MPSKVETGTCFRLRGCTSFADGDVIIGAFQALYLHIYIQFCNLAVIDLIIFVFLAYGLCFGILEALYLSHGEMMRDVACDVSCL